MPGAVAPAWDRRSASPLRQIAARIVGAVVIDAPSLDFAQKLAGRRRQAPACRQQNRLFARRAESPRIEHEALSGWRDVYVSRWVSSCRLVPYRFAATRAAIRGLSLPSSTFGTTSMSG